MVAPVSMWDVAPSAPTQTDLTGADGIATGDDVRRWLADAMPGDIALYARASNLIGSPIGPVIRDLCDQCLIEMLPQQRSGQHFLYRVRRTRSPRPSRPLPAVGAVQQDAEAELMLVKAVLRSAARAGAPCPSNAEIARRCGLSDADRARYRMRQLRETGVIRVEAIAAEPRRVVTIVSNGKRTGVVR